MNEAEIRTQVVDAVSATLKTEDKPVEMSSRLVDDLGGDSLDMLELMMALEERFGFEVPDEDAEGINTVGDVVEYVKRRLAGGAR
jgi:acyl carrier protein